VRAARPPRSTRHPPAGQLPPRARRPAREVPAQRCRARPADPGAAQPPAQPTEPLTSRQEEILIPVARGWTNHEIADDLHISISTVKTHLASLMRKLDTRNRVEIAMWAYETGRL